VEGPLGVARALHHQQPARIAEKHVQGAQAAGNAGVGLE